MHLTRQALNRLRLHQGGLVEVHQAICQDIVDTLRTARAGLWMIDATCDRLACVAHFSRSGGFLPGVPVLSLTEHPAYFEGLLRDGYLLASNARLHPRTRTLLPYFEAEGLHALLDLMIIVVGRPVAVLCCEHTEVRQWVQADLDYLGQMSALVGQTLQQAAKAGP